MRETLHSPNLVHIAEEMQLGDNAISRSVKVRTDTTMNIMRTEALSGHGLNVTGVAEQQKPIATNTSQRIIGTGVRRKGEPMSDFAKDTNVPTNDCISRQAAIDALISEGRNVDSRYISAERIIHESDAIEAISMLPSAEPWSAVRTILEELERKQEKLYADYCDATARLKAINKIAESSQAPRQKIDGIKPLAEMVVTE